ncbi:histidinol dehydrogenase [Aureispira anguillae]|uniref:Histidinol dehydrogenase n=1 Tax=Aureispira anguillae TaxID=2864201 RepID=A0A915YEU9_9BACT|nr:histidinol dehydrogenase [Aureispira anguillae]BDS11840.1 histidinol dehydrogenase [Aureispira anguillae]
MKTFINPEEWTTLLQRSRLGTEDLEPVVQSILKDIQQDGDVAVRRYTSKFDRVQLDDFSVSKAEIQAAIEAVSSPLKRAIQQAKNNIEVFHKSQKEAVQYVETMDGITCWRKSVGIDRVGLYIPAGTAPLFSTVLMLGIPAKLAGCREIVLCSPPNQKGQIHPAILYAASLVGCTKIFKVGGVQAIGAMAYGTACIPKVYKIFGPGNQYITCAKQLILKEGLAIDMPAGPSELLVWADECANPAFVAADLLSQAEHGTDSQVILVSSSSLVVENVQAAIKQQIARLPRKDMAQIALNNSRAIVLKDEQTIVQFINEYAPEHLILNIKNAEKVADQVINAGSVFLGNFTPESLGDYASGTNHTLPTNGFACNYSGLSLDSFVKKITFQKATKRGLKNIGWVVETMAAAEALEAHKNAISIRLKSMNDE